MKRINLVVMSAVALAGIVIGSMTSANTVFPPQPPPAHTEIEQQGRHVLQIAAGCGCHGANFAGWRAGGPDSFPRATPYGERFVGPFGDVPAPNITPDRTDGIGGWTDEQIATAITTGDTPYGTRLNAIMPYAAYHGMAASDIKALVAYLRRLRPVANEVPAPVLKQTAPEVVTDVSPPAVRPTGGVELGGYLVRHVCVCTDCHGGGVGDTHGDNLIGKVLKMDGESVVAPNLTPDTKTGIGTWSESDIARYLRTGSRPDGGLAQSAMAGLILTSFSHLRPAEARAIAAYLKSLPPVQHRPS